jgi:hypothetical protein
MNLNSNGPPAIRSKALVTPTQRVASSESPGRQTHRILKFHEDAFSVDLNDVPLVGSPDAPHVIVHLFDYSCHYCRTLHQLFAEVLHSLSNQVAIACLPVPLDLACNRVIKTAIPEHTNACAYARIGLAVWRANPAKSPAFDDWIFAPLRPPSPEAAQAEAMRLVGTNTLANTLKDPWINRQLDLGVRIYETNYRRYKKSQLPQLMIGTNIVSGNLRNVASLYRVLTNQLALHLPNE